MNEADLYNLHSNLNGNLIFINLLLEKKIINKREYNKLIKYEIKENKSKRKKA